MRCMSSFFLGQSRIVIQFIVDKSCSTILVKCLTIQKTVSVHKADTILTSAEKTIIIIIGLPSLTYSTRYCSHACVLTLYSDNRHDNDMAVTDRKSLFHCIWANSISYISRMLH